MMFSSKVPSDTVTFISLLDEDGETIVTFPMDTPVVIPQSQKIANVEATIRVDVRIELIGKTRHDRTDS
jgi:hypothetical protein